MEEFFSICPKFFPQPCERPDWFQRQSPQKSQKIQDPLPQGQKKTAEQQKVEASPQHRPQQQIEPHISVSRRHGVEKEGGHRQGPVEQIQK